MLTKIDWQLEIRGSAVDPLYVHVAHTKKATRRWPFYSQNALEAVHDLLRVSPAASWLGMLIYTSKLRFLACLTLQGSSSLDREHVLRLS